MTVGQYGPEVILNGSVLTPIAMALTSITVKNPDNSAATLYTDTTGATPLGTNVVTTDVRGNLVFYAAAGPYKLSYADSVGAQSLTVVVYEDATDLNATYQAKSISLYDDFTVKADGTIVGTSPVVGGAYALTGANPVTVTGGRAYNPGPGTGYVFSTLPDVDYLWAETEFVGADPAVQSMTLAFSDLAINNALHMNLGPQGFTLTARKDGGSFDTLPKGLGKWLRQIPIDGSAAPRIGMARIPGTDTLIVLGPYGERFLINDPRVSLLAGSTVFMEPNTSTSGGGMSARLRRWGATAPDTSAVGTPSSHSEAVGAGFVIDQNGRIVGNRDTAFEVAIGIDPTSGFRGVEFGPRDPYSNVLTSAAAISAMSIVTDKYIPSGSTIVLESGTNTETVTASAASTGTRPYATTVSALTKAHAVGTSATVTVPASYRCTVYAKADGTLQLPASVILANHLYWSGQTLVADQSASGVLSTTGSAGTGKGAAKFCVVTTANRPTAASVGAGAQGYDTTLSKPIWSDGTVWRDAAGTAV